MGKKFDYLQNHIDRLEHTNALLAHEEHILEFEGYKEIGYRCLQESIQVRSSQSI